MAELQPEKSIPQGAVSHTGEQLHDSIKQLGIPLEVPKRFTDRTLFPNTTVFDELTGLPVEDNHLRSQIAKEFSHSVEKGESFLFLYRDADNLKAANTKISREFGDIVIQYSAASLLQAIETLNLSDSIRIYATRQTGAADETVVSIFGATPEQITEIKEIVTAEDQKLHIHEPEYKFTTSTSIFSSTDEDAQEIIGDAKSFLAQNPGKTAFTEFNAIRQAADDKVKLLKIDKDVQRIDFDGLSAARGHEEVDKALEEEFSDSRISKEVYRIISQIQRFETLLELRETFESIESFRLHLSKTTTDTHIVHDLTSADPRKNFYDRMFHRTNNNG